jgi:hypothetical protein
MSDDDKILTLVNGIRYDIIVVILNIFLLFKSNHM